MKITKLATACILLATFALHGCKEDEYMIPATVYSNLIIYNGATGFIGDMDSSRAFLFIDTTNSPKDHPAIKLNYNYVYPGPFTGVPSPVRYMAVATGERRFRFALSDSSKITDQLVSLADHSYQTVYLSDSLSYFNVLVTRDTLVRLENKARMRLINLSPDAGPVQLYLDTLAIQGLSGTGYKSVTPFLPVDPGAFVAVRIRGTKNGIQETLVRKSIPLIAGRSYTVILRGYMSPEDKDPNKSIDLSILINQ